MDAISKPLLHVIFLYLNCKILQEEKKATKKELAIIVGLVLFSPIIYHFLRLSYSLIILPGIYLSLLTTSDEALATLGIVSYGSIFLLISNNLATIILNLLTSNMARLSVSQKSIFFWAFSFSLSVSFCWCLVKIAKKVKLNFNLDLKRNLFVTLMGFVTMVIGYTNAYLRLVLGNSPNLIQLNTLFLISYFLISILVFILYVLSIRNKEEIKRKEFEAEALQQYTEEVELHYNEVRKFKHDYQNILSSLDQYILDNDYEGLKAFYLNKLKPSFDEISKSEFKLGSLSNIKIPEIKSIFLVKLLLAQSLGIKVQVEVGEPIKHIAMDSLILVRILGIILDNAIEEIQVLTSEFNKSLSIALFESKDDIQIIVKNTCHYELSSIHQLKREGFSTKGNGRGYGLSILSELLNNLHNVILETKIENSDFTQRLIINQKKEA